MHYRFLILLLPCWLAACGGSDGSKGQPEAGQADAAEVDTAAAAEAAPRLQRSSYTSFQENLQAGPVSFFVSSPNVEEANTLVVASQGMQTRNDTFQIVVNAKVTGAEVADINQDSYPELYVFTTGPGAQQKGDVFAFASYKNRMMGEVYVPGVSAQSPMLKGYAGRDQFELVDTALLRRFPIYKGETPSGKERTIVYQLNKGESSYRLEAVEAQ
jgi:hypothetical protein